MHQNREKTGGLRKAYPDNPNINLEIWMQQSNNLYVGRRGRIFITDVFSKVKRVFSKVKRVFRYPESKWANPFKVNKSMTVKEYNKLPQKLRESLPFEKVGKNITLENSILYYKNYVIMSNLINDIEEISGKTLGCFCDQSGDCHAKVLVELFSQKINTK